jgi:hypothetical protein
VTHVLLQEGHVWGRKRVAIPIDAVTRVASDLEVGLTKHQVHDLPSVDIDDREHHGMFRCPCGAQATEYDVKRVAPRGWGTARDGSPRCPVCIDEPSGRAH